MNDDLVRITILHSNDIHGKFTGETGDDGKLRGSMAQVAGLVAQTKKDNPNTIYSETTSWITGYLTCCSQADMRISMLSMQTS